MPGIVTSLCYHCQVFETDVVAMTLLRHNIKLLVTSTLKNIEQINLPYKCIIKIVSSFILTETVSVSENVCIEILVFNNFNIAKTILI